MELKIASLEDIDATLRLHAKYQIDTINEEDKKDGFVTTAFTKEELTQLIREEEGLFILKKGTEVLAYVMAASWGFWSQWKMFEFMIENLEKLEYLGQKLSIENSYQYGPICIDKSLRGLGILEKMFNFSREIMSHKYPILVTFVNKKNPRSFEAHHRKLGLEIIKEFSYNGNEYYQMVYDTSNALNGRGVLAVADAPIEYLAYEIVANKEALKEDIYLNMNQHYYWTDDFSAEYYVAQARAGFIAVTMKNDDELYLIPEIQKEYALLDFKDLHVSKKVKRLLEKKELKIEFGYDFDELFFEIKNYHIVTWFRKIYLEMLKEVNALDDTCEVVTVVIRDKGKIVAGEFGYIIGKTYTSLTGFSKRTKEYNNYGTAQLVLLAHYLEEEGFAFLNLGQTYMPYKLNLGAKIYSREAFLERWFEAIG